MNAKSPNADKALTRPNEAQAKLEIEARQASEAVDHARRQLEAHEAEAQRVAAMMPPLEATDAQIDELALATVRSRMRADISKRALTAAEAAAQPIVERAAKLARVALRSATIEDQAAIVERFRALYPETVNKLLRLFAEAHAIMVAAGRLGNPEEGEQHVVQNPFQFALLDSPKALRVQVISRHGEVMWQGDQNTDIASQQF